MSGQDIQETQETVINPEEQQKENGKQNSEFQMDKLPIYLVPIGADYNQEKNGFSSYLMACYNQDRKQFQTLCKMSVGLQQNEQLQEKFEFFQDKILQDKFDVYHVYQDNKVDVWLQPSCIWEIRAQEISSNSVYTCSHNEVEGLRLRFPKFMKQLEDFELNQVSTSIFIYELYEMKNIGEQIPKIDIKDDEINEKLKVLKPHKNVIPYANLISYIYGRVSRNLNYDYADLTMEDFIIDVSSIKSIYTCFDRIITKTLSIIFQRYLMYPINNDSKDKLVLSNNESVRQLLEELGEYFQNRRIHELSLQNKIQWLSNQNFEQNQKSLKENMDKMELLIKVFIKQPEYFLRPTETFKYFQQCKLDTIEPFLGTNGIKKSLLLKTRAKYENMQQLSYENDIRGSLVSGKDNDTLYMCWHGSNNEFDWDTNYDGPLYYLGQSILPELPRHWKIHGGFSYIVQTTWNCPQVFDQRYSEGTKLFRNLLEERMKGKKTIYFTGHSQGAAIANLACIYLKYLYLNRKENYNIQGWFISTPRFLSKETAKEVDELFGVDQGSLDIVRQNVLGDPVSLGFQSVHDLLIIIKRGCAMLQVVFQKEVFSVIQNILSNREFLLQSMEAENKENANIKDSVNYKLFQAEILQPLKDKYNGNFPLFMKDYTAPKQKFYRSVYKDIMWKLIARKYRREILDFMPEKFKKILNITEKNITGKVIRNLIHNGAKILDISDPQCTDNFQNLILDSDYEYYNVFRKIAMQMKKKQNKGKNVLEEVDQMTFTKNILKSIMKSKLQEIFYFKELSYIGETIEGICHFSADYTDCGALLLDKIEFHDQCYRVENLNIFDKLMEFNQDQNQNEAQEHELKPMGKDKKKVYSPLNNDNFKDFVQQDLHQNIEEIEQEHQRFSLNDQEVCVDEGDKFEYSQNPTRLQKAYEYLLQYIGPYHYGSKQATLSPELLIESNLQKMFRFGQEYQQYSTQQKDEYFYSVGLLQKNKQHLISMFNSLGDFQIIKKRIVQKLDASDGIVEDIQSMEVETEIIIDIVKIVCIFSDLKMVKEVYGSEQEKKDQLKLLSRYSYFLSSYFKAIHTIYCTFDEKYHKITNLDKNQDILSQLQEQKILEEKERLETQQLQEYLSQQNNGDENIDNTDSNIQLNYKRLLEIKIDYDVQRKLPYKQFLEEVHDLYRNLPEDQKNDKQQYLKCHDKFLHHSFTVLKHNKK